ncbi:glyoxalase [uncultured Maribacter sp.]|uniref:glyoxalase n=1 Tax=uncultured Maribacter sp. TaxID=431308 RepID=UPI0026286977|nr:glyoxalase [uncultured Maribacter sp.]
MNDRSQYLLKFRPEVSPKVVNESMSPSERFQNQTLRPVLKFQNLILIAAFRNYITKHKNKFYELSLEKRMEFIENAVQRDIKFRNSLKGIIIGLFTEEEYQIYIQNSSALNKRMMNLVIKRLQDQIQLFEVEALIY